MSKAAATANAWLGVSIDFSKVEDKEATGSFEILPQGWYKAVVKNVVKSAIGSKNKPAITVHFQLEDEGTEISSNYFIPEQTDTPEAIEFKKQNLKNFMSRAFYSTLTKEEYDKTDKSINTQGPEDLIGKKVQVKIIQEPFMAQDQQTKAFKFTDIPKSYRIADMPKQLLNALQDQEKDAGVSYDKIPVFLFSNKVAAYGIGFYNDYEEKERKNSKAFDWVESLKSQTRSTAASTTNAATPAGIPSF